jgi:hypothetical protein
MKKTLLVALMLVAGLYACGKNEKPVEVQQPTPEIVRPVWHHGSYSDKMTGKVTKYSYVISTNSIDMKFPYQGGTTADITIHDDGFAAVTISKGQVMCTSYSGCSFLVKFDDNKPEYFRAHGSSNGDPKVLILCDSTMNEVFCSGKQFIKKLKKAKKVMIEVQVYQEGSPVFEFDVAENQ